MNTTTAKIKIIMVDNNDLFLKQSITPNPFKQIA